MGFGSPCLAVLLALALPALAGAGVAAAPAAGPDCGLRPVVQKICAPPRGTAPIIE